MSKSQLNELNVPKLRFKGFEDNWFSISLKDIEILPCFTNDNNLNFLDATAIMNKKYLIYRNEKFTYAPQDSIVFIKDGSNSGNFIYSYEQTKIASTCSYIITNQNNQFIHYLLEKNKSIINSFLIGETIPHLYKSSLLNIIFLISSNINEQTKIAKFFSLLDKHIELWERKLQLNELKKKYYLNNLFVDTNSVNQLPKLRFKGFDNSWIDKHIFELLIYEQPTKYLVTNENYKNDKKLLPVLTAGKSFILGYTDDIRNSYSKGDVIIMDDFTLDMRFINFKFKVKSSAIKLLTTIREDNIKFIFYSIKNKKLAPIGHNRHYISLVQNMTIKTPSSEEQNKIIKFLSLLEDISISIENNINNLLMSKKYFLANLFI